MVWELTHRRESQLKPLEAKASLRPGGSASRVGAVRPGSGTWFQESENHLVSNSEVPGEEPPD